MIAVLYIIYSSSHIIWQVNTVVIMGWQTKVGRSKRNDANTKQYCYREITLMITDGLGSQTLIQN